MVTTEELVNAILTIRNECAGNKDCANCRLRIPENPRMCTLQNRVPTTYKLAESDELPSIFAADPRIHAERVTDEEDNPF